MVLRLNNITQMLNSNVSDKPVDVISNNRQTEVTDQQSFFLFCLFGFFAKYQLLLLASYFFQNAFQV